MYDGGARLIIRAVPRINLQQLALPKEQRARGFAAGRGSGARPPQRYFDRAEILEASNGTAVIESRVKNGLRVDVMGSNAFRESPARMHCLSRLAPRTRPRRFVLTQVQFTRHHVC